MPRMRHLRASSDTRTRLHGKNHDGILEAHASASFRSGAINQCAATSLNRQRLLAKQNRVPVHADFVAWGGVTDRINDATTSQFCDDPNEVV